MKLPRQNDLLHAITIVLLYNYVGLCFCYCCELLNSPNWCGFLVLSSECGLFDCTLFMSFGGDCLLYICWQPAYL